MTPAGTNEAGVEAGKQPLTPSNRAQKKRWWYVPLRFVVLIVLALGVGSILNQTAASLESSTAPAGFRRGVLQGALMPMSFPNLLVGRDVSIYSTHNTGLAYKLGYTTGVNLCGAVFFGFLYWRLNRLRRWAKIGTVATKPDPNTS